MPGKRTVEEMLALHCAPALAGIKPSNLFTLHFSEGRPESREMEAASAALSRHGVSVETLCECGRYALIFVYREKMLEAAVTQESEAFLESYGYERGSSAADKIKRLKSRFAKCGEFPHEIGIFLGYPLEDVQGFIKSGGKDCKACGVWKVYGDEKRAESIFARYRKCTEYFCGKIESGWRIAQLMEQAAFCL